MARKPNLRNQVAKIRHALGLTAADFAKLVGCGASTIQHIETGDRVLGEDLAGKINATTGLSLEIIFGGTCSEIAKEIEELGGKSATTEPSTIRLRAELLALAEDIGLPAALDTLRARARKAA